MSSDPQRTVEEQPDGSGARDSEAPVGMPNQVPAEIGDLLDKMSEKKREKTIKQLVDAQPERRKVRRETARLWLTVILLFLVFVNSGAAIGLAIADVIGWEEAKDWLTLALVPLTPGVAVALAFWFPSRESE